QVKPPKRPRPNKFFNLRELDHGFFPPTSSARLGKASAPTALNSSNGRYGCSHSSTKRLAILIRSSFANSRKRRFFCSGVMLPPCKSLIAFPPRVSLIVVAQLASISFQQQSHLL